GGEGELADLVVYARRLELVLGLADRSDLGIGVDHGRHGAIVHVAVLTGDDLGHGDAFVLGLVREHGADDDVADGIDILGAGAVALADRHAAALVDRNADRREAEAGGVGLAADGDERHVGVDDLHVAALRRFDAHGERAV